MKCYVTSATNDDMPYEFENLSDMAEGADYDLKFHSPRDIEIIPRSKYYPTLKVKSHEGSNGVFTYDAIMTFPKLDTEDFSGYDTFEYYASIWYRKVSRLVEALLRFEYDPNKEYGDEDEED